MSALRILFVCMFGLFLGVTISAQSAMAIPKDPVILKVQAIQKQIGSEQWEGIENSVKELKVVFQKNKWKYQLLGDEQEFEGVGRRIDTLFVAVAEKDTLESRLIIAEIMSIIQEIYTL
jgi:hypothetical protein